MTPPGFAPSSLAAAKAKHSAGMSTHCAAENVECNVGKHHYTCVSSHGRLLHEACRTHKAIEHARERRQIDSREQAGHLLPEGTHEDLPAGLVTEFK
jgi:hypothetical protein